MTFSAVVLKEKISSFSMKKEVGPIFLEDRPKKQRMEITDVVEVVADAEGELCRNYGPKMS